MGNAAFTPSFTDYKDLKPFRFWCQKVLPSVYDDSLSYYELLAKVVSYLNDVIDDMEAVEANTDAILDAFNQLQEYVNEYLGSEEFYEQLDDAVDEFFASEEFTTQLTNLVNTSVGNQIGSAVGEQIGATVAGQIDDVVAGQIGGVVTEQIGGAVVNPVNDWMDANITNPTNPVIDRTLKVSGAAAESKTVGDKFETIVKTANPNIVQGLYQLPITIDTTVTADNIGVAELALDNLILGSLTNPINIVEDKRYLVYVRAKYNTGDAEDSASYIFPDLVSGTGTLGSSWVVDATKTQAGANKFTTAADAFGSVAGTGYFGLQFRHLTADATVAVKMTIYDLAIIAFDTHAEVVAWMNEIAPKIGVDYPSLYFGVPTYEFVDDTLTKSGFAADAKITGDHIAVAENISGYDILKNAVWELGTFDPATGAPVVSSTRIRTKFIQVNGQIDVHIDSGYKYNMYWYDANKSFIGHGIWHFADNLFNPSSQTKYLKVLLAAANDGSASTAMSTHISSRMYSSIAKDVNVLNDASETLAEEIVSPNLLNFSDAEFTSGIYVMANGVINSNAGYNTSGYIPVKEGEVYTYTYGTPIGTARYIRFISAYDISKNVIESAGNDSGIYSYTVPSEIAFIRLSCDASHFKVTEPNIMFYKGSTIDSYYPYAEPYWMLKNGAINVNYINSLISAKLTNVLTDYGLVMKGEMATMTSSDTLTVASNIDNKKNAVIEFMGYFSAFTSLTLGHGYNIGYGNYIVIDPVYVTVYNGAVPTQVAKAAHGLTISDFIHVIISQNDAARGNIKIISSSGSQYEMADCQWSGCCGNIFAKVGANMSDCVCNAVFKDFNKQVFVFGDSYISLGDPDRWTYYAMNNGFKSMLLDGYGGRNSANALISFNNVISHAIPKYAVWSLGMNDGDSEAINASWLSSVNDFISSCSENNITPILATIPNTPTVNNTYKNTWVRESGYRYIDFAKAVGAETAGSSWYTGMLSSDNVHPTALGARALYSAFMIAVPEVIR